MKHLQTKIMTETSNIPTEYEYKKVAVQRKLLTSDLELSKFKVCEAGAIGEEKFAEIMNEFGRPHWCYLRNMWFNDFSDFECDYLLFTSDCIYYIEVKNYLGKFVYRNGQPSLRGINRPYNPIAQTQNGTTHVRNILQRFFPGIPVKGVLVFIGENNQVQIHDQIDSIGILQINDVYQYIQNIISDERQARTKLDIDKILHRLEQHEIVRPHVSTPYKRSDILEKHTGIFCQKCARPLTMKRSKYVKCACGFQEFRDHLVVRTACEYGVLTHGTDFILSDIRHILNNQISFKYLKTILSTHFTTVPNESIMTFKNLGRSIEMLPGHFQFASPNITVH